ncbi:MAG: hypothetical protein GY785_25215 [Gammaproteobacteria bacterium]|nr:hypothetical protein [Gammaproteobacteria bacterium]
MTTAEIHRLGVGQLARAYRQRQLSPEQVCEHVLERIDDAHINCNAFALVDYDGARRAARDSSRRWLDGKALGPLDGIPLAIKDVLDVAGMPTRYGSAACAGASSAAQDSLLAQRLRAAGAILLGKTRTWEFAWRSNVERDPAEVVRNPHDPERSAGGSSGGSAAAVAAGLCPLAFGTDSGGSVRGPAGFCGIAGLKPSYAMIPVYPPSPMGDLEHIGILARSVADVRLAGSGLDLHAIEIPFRADFEQCYDLFVADTALTLELVPQDRRHLVDEQIVELAQQAYRMNVSDYAQAELVRAETQRVFAKLFDGVDCLLTLTQETVANRLDESPRIMKQTRCFNMTGQPAISIPGAVSSGGLPIGLQLVCDRGRDDLLLTIAERVAKQLADA